LTWHLPVLSPPFRHDEVFHSFDHSVNRRKHCQGDQFHPVAMKLLLLLLSLSFVLHLGNSFQVSPSHMSGMGGFTFVDTLPRSTNAALPTQPILRHRLSSSTLNASRLPFLGQGYRALRTVALRDLVWPRFQKIRRWTRRTFLAAALFLALNVVFANPVSARSGIRSGGRMGGSFGAPTRAPMMRQVPQSYQTKSQPRMIIHRGPHLHMHSHATTYGVGDTAVMSRGYAVPVRRLSMSDLVFVVGVGAVVTVNVMDKLKNGNGGSTGLESPLGPGVSVLSLTTALNVPDRDSPNSILARLSRLLLVSRTDSRKGVQDLIAETALELLRQKDYIISVDSQYSHFARVSDAQRAFNALSIGGRSKFHEETGT
jgi:Protein of unknown function (DUF1517)